MKKQTILIIVIGVLALVGGFGLSSYLKPEAQPVTKSHLLPEFSLPDLAGKLHAISEWQGKVRVINFWATWCPPCLKEMPEFNAVQKQYAEIGLQFIGIALDDNAPVKEFISANKIDYPILLGEEQGIKLGRNLGNVTDTVPFTVIVDKSGTIVKTHMGEITRTKLVDMIQPYL